MRTKYATYALQHFPALQIIIRAAGNAVEPIPTWPVTVSGQVATSTTPPSDINQYGALDFPLWQNIGEEFMVKSNINNWIACLPGTGSFSRFIAGSLTCRMIKSITINCPTLPNVPFSFSIGQLNFNHNCFIVCKHICVRNSLKKL